MSSQASSRKVLIVEDAETCAATLEIVFSSIRDLNIVTASSAEQAWEILENMPDEIHALVTDVHMPGMDGFELIGRVRSSRRHARMPILAITGSTDPATPARLLQCGADAVFSKPYSPGQVREKLEQLLSDEMRIK